MRKKELRAIFEKDIDSFLKKLGLLKSLERGELFCAVCNKPINKKNFRFIFPENGEIKFCCSKIECYEKIASKII